MSYGFYKDVFPETNKVRNNNNTNSNKLKMQKTTRTSGNKVAFRIKKRVIRRCLEKIRTAEQLPGNTFIGISPKVM